VATALAAAGADLILWGRAGSLAGTAAAVAGLGASVTEVTTDLSDLPGVRGTAERIADQHHVDILVNNAGVIRRAPAEQTSGDDWRAVLRVNLDAVFELCQVFGAGMLARGTGKIVNVASLLSFQGGIMVPAYAASKHAVAGLTRALANEWAPRGVNVNAVAPGYIATDNTTALREDTDREPQIRSRIPAGRWGDPDDIAGAVVFLASPAADYVHGHVLAVDGGWLAR
jgi:2-deoxy-D-gluconate 3-dehydrogenase